MESKPIVSLNVSHSRFVWLAPPDLSWWNLFVGLPRRWFGNFCFPEEGLCQLVPLLVSLSQIPGSWWWPMVESTALGEGEGSVIRGGRLRNWGEETGPIITVVMNGTGGRGAESQPWRVTVSPKGRRSAFVVVTFASQDHEETQCQCLRAEF